MGSPQNCGVRRSCPASTRRSGLLTPAAAAAASTAVTSAVSVSDSVADSLVQLHSQVQQPQRVSCTRWALASHAVTSAPHTGHATAWGHRCVRGGQWSTHREGVRALRGKTCVDLHGPAVKDSGDSGMPNVARPYDKRPPSPLACRAHPAHPLQQGQPTSSATFMSVSKQVVIFRWAPHRKETREQLAFVSRA